MTNMSYLDLRELNWGEKKKKKNPISVFFLKSGIPKF